MGHLKSNFSSSTGGFKADSLVLAVADTRSGMSPATTATFNRVMAYAEAHPGETERLDYLQRYKEAVGKSTPVSTSTPSPNRP